MSRFLRENSLSLFFLLIFLATLIGQAFVGHASFNHEQVAHQDATISLGRYLNLSAFWVDVIENWQSEYLQFTLFILGTVWLVQRGTTESVEGGEPDEEQKLGEHTIRKSPHWAKAGGLKTLVYSNSLVLLMGAIFLASWFAQLVTGRIEYNEDQLDHHERRSLWCNTPVPRTSGTGRCRTGSRNSSPSHPWSCSRSTCGSAGRASPSPWGRHTPRPPPKARRHTLQRTDLACSLSPNTARGSHENFRFEPARLLVRRHPLSLRERKVAQRRPVPARLVPAAGTAAGLAASWSCSGTCSSLPTSRSLPPLALAERNEFLASRGEEDGVAGRDD